MCVLRSFIPSQQKKTARPRMFRHFVPSRELHSLAPLMRLSLCGLAVCKQHNIYEDNVSGKLSDDRFAKMSRRYEDEQKEIS